MTYGSGSGRGGGQGGGGQGGGGQGRGGGRGRALGPGGECICPACGEIIAHQRGKPCYYIKCPKCGQTMNRKQ